MAQQSRNGPVKSAASGATFPPPAWWAVSGPFCLLQSGETLTKALLHGGPLDDTWWNLSGDAEPPRILVPQDGLGAGAAPVLIADFPVGPGVWRYERDASQDGRVVYVWAEEARAMFEFVAVIEDGPAAGYNMSVLGLTEPWPYMRLAPRPGFEPGGHMEWLHIPWPDTPAWEGEVTYVLTGTLIPPRGGTPEAFYRQTASPPWVTVERSSA